jgi:hypothetical protein
MLCVVSTQHIKPAYRAFGNTLSTVQANHPSSPKLPHRRGESLVLVQEFASQHVISARKTVTSPIITYYPTSVTHSCTAICTSSAAFSANSDIPFPRVTRTRFFLLKMHFSCRSSSSMLRTAPSSISSEVCVHPRI